MCACRLTFYLSKSMLPPGTVLISHYNRARAPSNTIFWALPAAAQVALLPSKALLQARLAARAVGGLHFMPPALLESQLAIQEAADHGEFWMVVSQQVGSRRAAHFVYANGDAR